MGRWLERYFPVVLALIAPVAYFGIWRLVSHAPSLQGIGKLTGGILSLAGILVGFLATAQALLYALPDRRAIKFLREAGALSDLVTYLFTDIIVWLVTAITALVLLFIGGELLGSALRILTGMWLLLPMWGIVGLVRSMYIFAKFLRLSASGSDSVDEESAA
jgi:hypothetical protein